MPSVVATVSATSLALSAADRAPGRALRQFPLRGRASSCSSLSAKLPDESASWRKSIRSAPVWHWDRWIHKSGKQSADQAPSPCSNDGTGPSACHRPDGELIRGRCNPQRVSAFLPRWRLLVTVQDLAEADRQLT